MIQILFRFFPFGTLGLLSVSPAWRVPPISFVLPRIPAFLCKYSSSGLMPLPQLVQPVSLTKEQFHAIHLITLGPRSPSWPLCAVVLVPPHQAEILSSFLTFRWERSGCAFPLRMAEIPPPVEPALYFLLDGLFFWLFLGSL